jgi:DNA polymerase-3 subunit gamma/tau
MGSAGREGMLPVVRAVASASFDGIFAAVDEAVASSRDLTVFWQDLISIYRDMLVLKTTDAAAKYLDLTDHEVAQLTELTAAFSKSTLLAHCKLLEDALFAMQNANAVKRMVAELTLVRMCDASLDTSAEGLLARIERLEDAVSGIPMPLAVPSPAPQAPVTPAYTPAPTAEPKAPPVKSTPQPSAPTPSSAQNSPKAGQTGRVLQRMRGFMNCVERIRRENMMLASFLTDVKVFLDDKGGIVCKLPNDFVRIMLEENVAKATLARAIGAELKRPVEPGMLVFELPDATTEKTDTILDDLLEAAENG